MGFKFILNPLPKLNGPTGSHTIEIWAKSKIVLFSGHPFIYVFKYILRWAHGKFDMAIRPKEGRKFGHGNN